MRSHRPRVRHTAGSRGWARVPGQTYDPADDPESIQNLLREETFVSKTKTLEPADLIERAEQLGATSRPAAHQKTMIYPPDKSQPPVSIAPRFGNGHDRMNAISNLKKAGLDVINDPRLNGTAVVGQPKPTPALMPKRQPTQQDCVLQPHSGDDPEAPGEPEETSVSWSDVEGLFDMLEELQNQVHAISGDLAAALASNCALESRIEGLEQSNQALAACVSRIEKYAPVPTERRDAKYARIGEAVVKLLAQMPAAIPLTMSQLAEGAQLAEEDRGSPLRTAVGRLIEAGRVVAHGKGSGMTYTLGTEG